jgi:NAD-dependent deacetylase
MHNEIQDILLNAEKPVVITGYSLNEKTPPLWSEFTKLMSDLKQQEITVDDMFRHSPLKLWQWYEPLRQKQRYEAINQEYHELKRLEDFFQKMTVITQDFSGTHLKAGNEEVYELYGNCDQAFCSKDMSFHTLPGSLDDLPPLCTCGDYLKPNLSWFGGGLNDGALRKAYLSVVACDLLILLGIRYITQPLPFYIDIARKNGAKTIEVASIHTALSGLVDHQLKENPAEFLCSLI